MRSLLNRETGLWVILAIAMLLTAAAGRYNVYRMESSEQILQTTRVIHADLSALRADMAEAETGHRGYLLTSHADYLEPIWQAEIRVLERLNRLRDQVAMFPNQTERLATAVQLVREKFEEMRRIITLHDALGREVAAEGVADGQGKRTMERFMTIVQEMQSAEEVRLSERTETAFVQYRTAEFTNILAAVLSIGTLAGLAIISRREERKRSKLSDKLANSKIETENALARLDVFLQHAPYGIAYFDSDLRYIAVNEAFARDNGLPVSEHLCRTLMEVLPDFPSDLLGDYQQVIATGKGFNQRLVRSKNLSWEVTAFAVPQADGQHGLGVIGVDVTDRLSQEEQLRMSEKRFRAMADGISQLAWITRPDGHIIWYNQRWYDYTGTTINEMDGWGWDKVHDPAELPRVMEKWKSALSAGEPFEDTFPLRRHDGEMRWHLTRAIPSKDANGKVQLWFGTNTDITDQRQKEKQLRDSEARFRDLADAMPQIVYAFKSDGEMDYVNRRWLEYTGQPNAGPEHLELLVPKEDRDVMAERWAVAVASGCPFECEFRLKNHADGEYRWFLSRTIPIRDANGTITQWYGTSTDIHHRKCQAATLEQMVEERTATLHRTNVALLEQKIFLDAILNNIMEGIVACDGEGQLKIFNTATKRMHGLPPEPLLPEKWAEHYQLYEADGVTIMPSERVPLMRAWRGEIVQDAEMLIRTTNGPDRYVLCSGVQLKANDGTQFGAVVSMRDMTERREYERRLLVTAKALEEAVNALQNSNDALKSSNEELEKFAYIASHDLQEPLRKIQAFGTRLAGKHRETLGEQGKDYIDRMLNSAGRMSKLIEDLLSFSRVTTKLAPFEKVRLSSVIEDVLQDLELRIQQSGGHVEVGWLPVVSGDVTQLRRVFQNLIGNALKFTKPGVPPVVRVYGMSFDKLPANVESKPPDGEGWRITVEDNGIGFEQGYSDRIFELFQRLHTRIDYEGTGLGLAIVRKIILRHGATIKAIGSPLVGATFIIDWPTKTNTTV